MIDTRSIILDTETTGLSPNQGHRITEIGCVEMINLRVTGRVYHTYVNPERDVPDEAARISGLSTEFLRPFPVFKTIFCEFLEFIEGAQLVIHNASFDIGFLNAELKRVGYPVLFQSCNVIDTVKLSRQLFPGAPANLDALCRKFSIDLSSRTTHGALIDARLLAQVYVELCGGRQRRLFESKEKKENSESDLLKQFASYPKRPARSFKPIQEEENNHAEFCKTINNALWLETV